MKTMLRLPWVLLIVGCGGMNGWVKSAISNAPILSHESNAEKTLTHGADGSSYRVTSASADRFCVLAVLDNYRQVAAEQKFELDAYRPDSDKPLATYAPVSYRVRDTSQQMSAGVRTGHLMIDHEDNRIKEEVRLANVDYPISEMEMCFPPGALDTRPGVLVLRKLKNIDGIPPSVAAWRVAR